MEILLFDSTSDGLFSFFSTEENWYSIIKKQGGKKHTSNRLVTPFLYSMAWEGGYPWIVKLLRPFIGLNGPLTRVCDHSRVYLFSVFLLCAVDVHAEANVCSSLTNFFRAFGLWHYPQANVSLFGEVSSLSLWILFQTWSVYGHSNAFNDFLMPLNSFRFVHAMNNRSELRTHSWNLLSHLVAKESSWKP